jgi:ubiquitin-protein ligase
MSLTRLTKEIKEVQTLIDNKSSNIIEIKPNPTDIKDVVVVFKGPDQTPFSDLNLTINLQYPDDYPFKPPKVIFISKMYHPNISTLTGQICLETVLTDKWSPTLRLPFIVQSITSLLSNPNCENPIEAGVADEYQNNRDKYNENVLLWYNNKTT